MSEEKKEPNYPDWIIRANPHGSYWCDIGSAWNMEKGIRLIFHALPVATNTNKGEPITKAVMFPFEKKDSD